jgi:hypothetical protein
LMGFYNECAVLPLAASSAGIRLKVYSAQARLVRRGLAGAVR